MVQTAGGSPEEGAGRQDDDMSNPMWAHIIRLLDDEEQATMVLQIFKQAMITRAIETDLSARDRAQHVGRTSDLVAAELAGLDSLKGVTDLQRRQQLLLATRVVINFRGLLRGVSLAGPKVRSQGAAGSFLRDIWAGREQQLLVHY